MVIKIYSGVGQGESLYKAIIERGNGCYNPPMIDKWIEEQQEAYMEKDWDGERLHHIVWKMENAKLINFLNKIEVDIDSYEACWNPKRGNKNLKSFFKNEKVENNSF